MAKILIVDDSNMLRDMLKYALLDGGYSDVDEAIDGVEALNIAKEKDFDLVITDINMPNMDGFDLIDNLRKIDNYKTKPLLVLTTERTEEMKQRGKEVGATGWIVKPFLPEQLITAITTVLK
jgi:two-component system chemotaxis response regulator CheY